MLRQPVPNTSSGDGKDVMYPLQTMTSLAVMTMSVAVWLLPAAGDVIGDVDHACNTTSTYNASIKTPPSSNSSVKQLIYYRVSCLVFARTCFFIVAL